ncbi:phenylalanine--tRNA ligase subunit alpha [Sulfurisphaera ohwakuensis]|uniref:phenylalanine--tRNA ligase subunit alpha n=1 Tax=Sulfurisphaera ohwakuensis TaxID=69656 RepID=UPI0036F1B879
MLSESEIKILEYLSKKREASAEDISKQLNIPIESVFSISQLLKEKGYIEVEEKKVIKYELTDEGKRRLKEGFPEEKLVKLLDGKEKKIHELKDKLGRDFEISIGWAKRKGLVKIDGDTVIPLVKDYEAKEEKEALINPEKANKDILQQLLNRKLLIKKEEKILNIRLIREPLEIKPALIFLTPELLASGEWKKYALREYNVEAYPPFYPIGKKHFFKEFLERLRDLMRDLGFKEVYSDYVEIEFYNFDLLFQAQDHPAREIHDSFAISGKGKLTDEKLIERVKQIHERGWKYNWDVNISMRLMLRSQTTATTARVLASRPKPPIRVFTIGKVFRPDSIDATHLTEFHQLDGLVIEDNFTFRDLLGTLKEIFNGIGIKEIRFKPAYFPFTEPSVEVYGKIEGLGWVEMAGAGLLRPEILEAVEINSSAGAWGLGIDRLAMLLLGLKDIRLLYATDIEYLRNRKVEINADN